MRVQEDTEYWAWSAKDLLSSFDKGVFLTIFINAEICGHHGIFLELPFNISLSSNCVAKIPNIVKISCTQDIIVQPFCFTALKVKASMYAISYLQMQLMLGLGLFSLLIKTDTALSYTNHKIQLFSDQSKGLGREVLLENL